MFGRGVGPDLSILNLLLNFQIKVCPLTEIHVRQLKLINSNKFSVISSDFKFLAIFFMDFRSEK